MCRVCTDYRSNIFAPRKTGKHACSLNLSRMSCRSCELSVSLTRPGQPIQVIGESTPRSAETRPPGLGEIRTSVVTPAGGGEAEGEGAMDGGGSCCAAAAAAAANGVVAPACMLVASAGGENGTFPAPSTTVP